MREARIIMPKAETENEDWFAVHTDLEAALVEAFGGCTSYAATGSWNDGQRVIREDVIIYDVAVDPSVGANHNLCSLACAAGQLLQQEAVYIRYPNGTVVIHDLKEQAASPGRFFKDRAAAQA